mmetsp:Transcript_62320/g.72481  ORF Transcript_62320/g.72481 Transcript_62320/m.72481 type:complete len:80 (+) Transcript_62320:347-586(+)
MPNESSKGGDPHENEANHAVHKEDKEEYNSFTGGRPSTAVAFSVEHDTKETVAEHACYPRADEPKDDPFNESNAALSSS